MRVRERFVDTSINLHSIDIINGLYLYNLPLYHYAGYEYDSMTARVMTLWQQTIAIVEKTTIVGAVNATRMIFFTQRQRQNGVECFSLCITFSLISDIDIISEIPLIRNENKRLDERKRR